MTKLGLRPYLAADQPGPGSVPVSVLILTLNEEANIRRCLASVAWADQVVVVDSGSVDETITLAESMGADVVQQSWLGFGEQREFALRLALLKHNWVYFVDADEWVSPQLAQEIATRLHTTKCAAFTHRLRLVFHGTWIRHCGWYRGSWVVRLVDRRYAKYDGSTIGERAHVDGNICQLRNDIVDEDLKSPDIWLNKHVSYALLEAGRRSGPRPPIARIRALRFHDSNDTRPHIRAILKDVIYPSVPLKPAVLFVYMFILRLGFLDGSNGLLFCFYHAWYEVTVSSFQKFQRAHDKCASGEVQPTSNKQLSGKS